MSAVLEIAGVTKRFGSLTAVDDVSFTVEPGQICGFIGPNGAGKTTTMRIVATLDLPDEGDVRVLGRSVCEDPREVRKHLGFMPDSYGSYTNVSVRDYLDFFARAYGLRGQARARTLDHVSDFTGLTPLIGKQMSVLSKGMRQRLCLAKTLLHDPTLLILDEPAAGLDPRARIELRELIKALADMQKAVLVSSHILSELAEVCSHVAVIEAGRLRATGTVSAMHERLAQANAGARVVRRVFVRTLARLDEAQRVLAEQPFVEEVSRERDGLVFGFTGAEADLAGLLAELVQRDLQPIEFMGRSANLEDVFLSLTEGQLQ